MFCCYGTVSETFFTAFARHFESQAVTFNRLMRFRRPIVLELSHYLDMEVVDGTTKSFLSKNILTAWL